MSKYAGGFGVPNPSQSNVVTPVSNPYQESNSYNIDANISKPRSKMNVLDAGQDDFLGKMMSGG